MSDSVQGEFQSARTSLKSALYALVEMIDKWDESGNGEDFGSKIGPRLGDEEIGALRSLLKNLREIEQFYDCIGGIIGLVVSHLVLHITTTLQLFVCCLLEL